MITCCKKLFIFYSTADQYAYWWVVLHSTYIITFNKIYICMIGCMYRTCMMYTCSTCSSLLFHHIFFFLTQITPLSPNLPPSAVTGLNEASGANPPLRPLPPSFFSFASCCFAGGCCTLSKSDNALV